MAGKYAAPRGTTRALSPPAVASVPFTCKPCDRKTAPILLVHAGALRVPDDYCAAFLRGVREAANYGFIAMMETKNARDGVEAAVIAMENNPIFSAGQGSALTQDGRVECEAGIMEGRSMKAGAVGAVSTVKNPIRVARAVMDRTDHVLMVGPGAEKFAEKIGLPKVDNSTLITEKAVKNLKRSPVFSKAVHNMYSAWAAAREVSSKTDLKKICSQPGMDCDSVGAVALDPTGRTAVAVSSGGISGKMHGRLGDACIPGSGFYADDNIGVVCCTGHGEMIMKSALAHRVINSIGQGMKPQKACEDGLDFMQKRLDGYGGVIAVSSSGSIGLSFSTFRMAWAYRTMDELHYGIDRDDHYVQKPGDPLDASPRPYRPK